MYIRSCDKEYRGDKRMIERTIDIDVVDMVILGCGQDVDGQGLYCLMKDGIQPWTDWNCVNRKFEWEKWNNTYFSISTLF